MQRPKRAANEEEEEEEEQRMHCEKRVASAFRGKFSIQKKKKRDKRRKEKDLGFETNYPAKLNGKIEEEKEKEGERED